MYNCYTPSERQTTAFLSTQKVQLFCVKYTSKCEETLKCTKSNTTYTHVEVDFPEWLFRLIFGGQYLHGHCFLRGVKFTPQLTDHGLEGQPLQGSTLTQVYTDSR